MRRLREPGAILLVSLYELGHQPQGLAGPLGFLRAGGFAPETLDLFAERLDEDRLRRAALVLVSVPMHTALRLGVRFLERARALHPQALYGFYGLYASLNGDFLLKKGADAIVGGEYEAALRALAEALEGSQGPHLPSVPGVRTREAAAEPILARLPLVMPRRDGLLPLSRYAQYDAGDGSAPQPAGAVEASRGCKHLCRHCPIPPVYGGRFFVVPVDIVLADVAQQVAAGARHITFADPDFLNGPRHALAVARALHAAYPALTFDATVKVEHIVRHRELWPELSALGCRFVVTAVESLSPTVLQLLDKGHTAAQVHTALAILRAAGIAMRPSLVPFTPWSTLADYHELLRFVQEEGLEQHVDPVQLTIRLLVPPGSYLLSLDELRPHLGPLDEERLTYRWRHPDPHMDALQEQAARLVEDAVRREQSAVQTLQALRQLAGLGAAASWPATASPVPRLTEPWFC